MHSPARLERLLDYLAQDPRNPRLLADVADEQARLGDLASAQWSLTQLLAQQPGDPELRYRLAVLERANGQTAEATNRLLSLVSEGHDHPVVVIELARCHAAAGDWKSVVPALSGVDASALEVDQGDAVRQLRIRALHQLGDIDAALTQARAWQALRGAALPVQGHAALCTLMLDAERLDELAALVSGLAPHTISANAELSMAAGYDSLGRDLPGAALDHFTQSLQLDPTMARALLGQGLALAAQGEPHAAIEALRAAVAAAPEHLGSWHALGWMQLLTDDIEGASASFGSALQQDDSFGETHAALALLAALKGEREASERQLRTALRLDPQSSNALVAQLVLEQGSRTLSPELLARAVERFSRGANASASTFLRLMRQRNS